MFISLSLYLFRQSSGTHECDVAKRKSRAIRMTL